MLYQLNLFFELEWWSDLSGGHDKLLTQQDLPPTFGSLNSIE